jgi:hypothetical protein
VILCKHCPLLFYPHSAQGGAVEVEELTPLLPTNPKPRVKALLENLRKNRRGWEALQRSTPRGEVVIAFVGDVLLPACGHLDLIRAKAHLYAARLVVEPMDMESVVRRIHHVEKHEEGLLELLRILEKIVESDMLVYSCLLELLLEAKVKCTTDLARLVDVFISDLNRI